MLSSIPIVGRIPTPCGSKPANGFIQQNAWRRRYAGIGTAIAIRIDTSVSVTIRQSDTEPIASVAATASCSLEEAAGAGRATKPAVPGDRIMAVFL